MHPSLRVCSVRAHTPLIKFLGRRTHPSSRNLLRFPELTLIPAFVAPDAPHPHPAAPADLKARFSEFLAKMNASGASEPASKSSSGNNTTVYNEFWEAPSRLWKPKVRYIEEAEVNAIMSGGASAYRY
ncbi:hypothetical protein NLJ89_g3012 [Agrocybe chaxingu]|uniref:Uncharacterized protein n=1 Tax=Agrocybe chaxingu TaxID=84603 RepID=A0A9W8MYH9_9AGAR|nr:hypothetical protein NLJ89_g3012 [Agrocybe chaxingu]